MPSESLALFLAGPSSRLLASSSASVSRLGFGGCQCMPDNMIRRPPTPFKVFKLKKSREDNKISGVNHTGLEM